MSILGPRLTKLAFQAATPKMKAQVKVDEHLSSPKPDWDAFVKNLKGVNFRKAVLEAEQSDPKLKKYVKNFGGYLASKDVVAKIESKDSGKSYVVKDLHNGRWGCNCGDWQYVHSVQGGDCKHVRSVRKSKLVKAAGLGFVPYTAGATAIMRIDKQRKKGLVAKDTVRRINAA